MYEYVTKYQQIGNFISDIQKVNLIGLDTETTGTDFFSDKLLLLQVKLNNNTYVFDARKLGEKYVNYIVQVLNDSGKTLIGHNIKFDVKFLCVATGELLLHVFDTMIAEVMITNGLAKGKDRYFSLNDLTEKYLGITLEKETRNSFIGKADTEEITEQEIIYSATDVQYLEQIMIKQVATLGEQKQLKVLDLEMMLLPVIVSMELEGVKVDEDVWKRLGGQAFEKAEELKKELVAEMVDKAIDYYKDKVSNALELADAMKLQVKRKRDRQPLEEVTDIEFVRERIKELFNLNSSDQVQVILHDVYGIPIEDTNEKTLDKFVVEFPIIKKIFEYREQAKSVSTYGDKFLQEVNPITGRIHTEFNQMGMVSGRISSSKPKQNWAFNK